MMHKDDHPLSAHEATVVDDQDPFRRRRLRVQIPGVFDSPVWVLPLFTAGVFAVPAIGKSVLVLQTAPSHFRWAFELPGSLAEVPSPDLLLEYPNRVALTGRLVSTAAIGIDAAGLSYLGHFKATEPAVLGNKLQTALTKLAAACSDIATALSTTTAPPGGGAVTPGPTLADATTKLSEVSAALSTILSAVAKVAATPTT